jgi:hypothetical protein
MRTSVSNQNKYKVFGVFISLLLSFFGQNIWAKDMNVLQGNIRFKLEIEGHGLRYSVRVNDVVVFRQLDPDTQNKFELPLNHLMHPEKSKFSVLGGSSKEGPFPVGTEVKLTLLIQDRDTEASYRLPILSLNGDHVYDVDLKKIDGILETGRYHLAKNNKVDSGSGEIELYNVKKEPHPTESDWFDYNRVVSVPNNLPLWAFFNMDDLPDYYAMSEDDRVKAIKDLFVEYKKVQDALLNDDIDSIMPMFKLRNDELDIAFDFEPGTMEKN